LLFTFKLHRYSGEDTQAGVLVSSDGGARWKAYGEIVDATVGETDVESS
jgi:hypothetical protein